MANEIVLVDAMNVATDVEKQRLAKLLHQKFCSIEICKLNWCGVKVCSHTDKLWQDRAERLIAFGQKNKVELLELETFLADF